MEQLKVSVLKPNPINSVLYTPDDQASQPFQEFLASVKENGILQPLNARADYTLLSGHRRLEAAKLLGLETVPVEIITGGDDRQLIIEFNRQRVKTVSERMREAEMLEQVVRERNRAVMGDSLRILDEGETKTEKIGETREVVSASVGMKRSTFEKARKLYEVAKVNPNAAEKLEKVDKGELSVDAAFKAVRTLIKEDTDDTPELEIPEFIRFYTSWQFSENDPRFGQPHPGRIPGQIPANIIYYFSQPGDLVVDPMSGGGSTLDAALFLGRECLAYDVVPKRPDISQHDISTGFPKEAKGCQLIFMDPPYWNMKDEGYSDLSSSRMDLGEFKNWYYKLMVNSARTVKVGGFVAVINMGQYFRLPEDFKDGYIDWPVFAWNALHDEGMRPWSRIVVTYPTSLYGGYDVDAAKKGRFLLPNVGDIIVMRRIV